MGSYICTCVLLYFFRYAHSQTLDLISLPNHFQYSLPKRQSGSGTKEITKKAQIAAVAINQGQLNNQMGEVLFKLATMDQKIGTDADSKQLTRILDLPPNYNKFEIPYMPPNVNLTKIPVTVGIRVRNIRGIDVWNEEMSMEIDLVTHWFDFAIKLHHSRARDAIRVLDSAYLKEIWWPHLFFSRTASIVRPDPHGSHSIPRPVKLSINPRTGDIEMSSRLVLKLYCPMNFKYYPADTQTCEVRLRSYADTVAEIDLKWHVDDKGIPEVFLFNRGHANFDIHLLNVTQEVKTEYSISNIGSTYTYLQFSLSTRRKLSFHVMQTFAPSIFLVVITWLAFFIPVELLEARIGISMTILLTLTAMFASIKEYTPQVSYIKAIDTWMLVCIVFVFLNLFEFTFLMYLRNVHERAHSKAVEVTMNMMDHPDMSQFGTSIQLKRLQEKRRNKTVEEYLRVEKVFRIATKTVETYGLITLSLGFFVFNMVYWPWLLSASEYYDAVVVNDSHNAPI